MEIYLIRHGDCCKAGLENYDESKKTVNPRLTEKGYQQVQKLAERCANIKQEKDQLFPASISLIQLAIDLLQSADCNRKLYRREICSPPGNQNGTLHL